MTGGDARSLSRWTVAQGRLRQATLYFKLQIVLRITVLPVALLLRDSPISLKVSLTLTHPNSRFINN